MKLLVSLLIDIAATYRLTKLILEDNIAEGFREFIFEHFPNTKLSYFVTCPWCVSFWMGVAVFVLRRYYPQHADIFSGALAASAVTGVAYTGHL